MVCCIIKFIKSFDIEVKDARTDFEVSIQDYNPTTNIITFGIINIGKIDAQALTLNLPVQDNIDLKGSSTVVVGSLNSNDDTTATIYGVPKEGEIKVNIDYNDVNGVRRTLEKSAVFTKAIAEKNVTQSQPKGAYFYLFWLIIIILVVMFVRNYFRKKKEKNNRFLRNRE